MNRPSKIALSALALALLAGAASAQQAGSSTAPTAGAQSPRQMDQAGVSRHATPDSTMQGGSVMALPGGEWSFGGGSGSGSGATNPGPSWQRVAFGPSQTATMHGEGCGCSEEAWKVSGVDGGGMVGDPGSYVGPASPGAAATGTCASGDYYSRRDEPISGPVIERGWTCVFK